MSSNRYPPDYADYADYADYGQYRAEIRGNIPIASAITPEQRRI